MLKQLRTALIGVIGVCLVSPPRVVATGGDLNGDDRVDLTDYGLFFGCLSAPGQNSNEPSCDPAKFDQDFDVDLFDFAGFQNRFGCSPCFDNLPPALGTIGDRVVSLGNTLSLQLSATDMDGDSLTFTAFPQPLPPNATLDGTTGLFVFRPGADQVGIVPITFFVTDGISTDSEQITITIQGPTPGGVTAISGRILDTNDYVNGITTPVVGAGIALLPLNGPSTTSDSTGNFILSGISAGHQVLDIDTSTAQPAPDGSPYAGFREEIDLIANVNNAISRPFFLPRVDMTSMTPVDPAKTTVVHNPILDITMTVPPHTAKNHDGTDFAGMLSISEVPSGTAPAALPEAIEVGVLITIQPVGVAYTQPVPITFPNSDNLPPGNELDLWSLDAGTGQFVVVGTGRVNDAGTAIETIAGGILANDWHKFLSLVLTVLPRATDATCGAEVEGGSRTSLASGNLSVDHTLATYRSLGQARSLRLVYNSLTADPRPIFRSTSTVSLRAAVPPRASVTLLVGGVTQPGQVFTDTSGFNERIDEDFVQAIQLDATAYPTGFYPYRLKLTSHYPTSAISGFAFGTVVVNNQRTSPYGAGWGLDQLPRLYPTTEGILLVEGNGRTLIFQSTGLTESRFDHDTEGWSTLGDADPPVYSADGGNPGGHICAQDNGGGVTWFWRAPAQFLGDRSSAYGHTLAYDLTAFPNAPNQGNNDVILVGGGITMRYDNSHNPQTTWTSFTVPLQESSGWIRLSPTRPATAGEIMTVLGSLTEIRIRGEFSGSLDTGCIDNVVLTESAGSLSNVFTSPPGDFSTLRRNGNGTYTRTLKDGTAIHFDGQGLQTSVVDRNGNAKVYGYQSGLLTSITDPVGLVTNFEYQDGRLARITDPANRITLLEHDGAGDLRRIVDPDGTSVQFDYDSNHRLKRQTSKRGHATNYEYDFAGRHIRSQLPDDSIRSVTSDETVALVDLASGEGSQGSAATVVRPQDEVARFTDGDNYTTIYRLGALGLPTEIVDPVMRRTGFQRDDNGLPTQIEWPNGRIDQMTYDNLGNLTLLKEAVGTMLQRQTKFENYDPVSNQVGKITDPGEKITTITYDTNGNPEIVTDPLGFQRIRTYFPNGLLSTSRDENLHTTTYTYDATGLLDTITDAIGSVTDYHRDPFGNVASITEGVGTPDERTRSFGYDLLNRMASATDGEQHTWLFRYDDQGNLHESETPTGEITRREYDALDRVTLIDDPITGPTIFVYDHRGNVTKRTDALNHSTTFEYDGASQLRKTTDALGGVETYDYDLMGNLDAFTDANYHATTLGYDLLNRRTRRTNPLNQTATYTYDSRDNLKTQTKPDGQVIVYDYDDRSRLEKITTPDNVIDYDYDGVGNLTVADDLDSKLRFTYDNVNRVKTAATLDAPGVVQPAVTLTYGYDAVGNRRSLSDSLGATTQYDYDAVGRLIRITTPESHVIEEDYDPTGRLSHIYYPNGITAEYDYDVQGRLTRLTHASASETLLDFVYAYNPVGNITSIAEPTRGRTFTYDALQRLRIVGTPDVSEFYNYDAVGNRTSSHLSAMHMHDAANRLLQDKTFTYTYDTNGNLYTRTHRASQEVSVFSWAAQGQLTRIDLPDSAVLQLSYDAFGRRIGQELQQQRESYLYDYDGDDLLLAFDAKGVNASAAFYGHQIDEPLAIATEDLEYFIHRDYQQSVVLLSDANGHPTNTCQFSAYGQLLTFAKVM